jgi:hypothetical protein
MATTGDKELLDGVIIGFRNLINDRYQYATLKERYELPDSLDEERMTLYREFFLQQVYPHPERRELLEEAFRSLDDYLTHPDRMMRIVFDSAAILFRHGASIPKLLSTGIKAFRSFRVATEFEAKLVRKARSSGKLPPYSTADINAFITALRKRDIDEFVANTTELLEILYDRKLVRQLIDIMTDLIAKMKKAPRSYSETEIEGLSIGLNMLIEGNRLFDSLPPADQRRVLNVIVAIEVDVLEQLFSE